MPSHVEPSRLTYQRQSLRAASEPASLRGAWLGIDLAVLADNLAALRRAVKPNTRIMAVVKADAYGHGAQAIAEAALLSGASALGVATVEEGVRLRRSGIQAPILLLGILPDAALAPAVEAGLQITVSSLRQIQALERLSIGLGRIAEAHLKVNTGMSRVGCELTEAPMLVRALQETRAIRFVGLSSHLASAESPGESSEQIAAFAQLAEGLRLNRERITHHLANSAGALYWPEAHFDMVRVGLAMYGHSPRGFEPAPVPLSRVLSLRARIAQVKTVPKGTTVGYGSTWTAPAATELALLPVGYADGVPRAIGNTGEVLVRGVRRPIVGRVSMDQMIVDVGDLAVMPGEEVVLLGGGGPRAIRIEEWAESDHTIAYELLCALGARLPRVFYR